MSDYYLRDDPGKCCGTPDARPLRVGATCNEPDSNAKPPVGARAAQTVPDQGPGRKATAGLRYDLYTPYQMTELALVATMGARKYAPWNWRRGLPWSSCVAALLRHLWQWMAGEARDADGQHHLASVAWHALALMEFERYGLGSDDRAPLSPETARMNEEAKK